MSQLALLPAELYTAIFEQFDGTLAERTQAILALIRAIPRSPVPDTLLFERVHLTRPKQAFLLYRRLREAPHDASRVRFFVYECWSADAQSVVNVLKLLRNLEEMSTWFGPDFAPEHVEEIFSNPRTTLKRLWLRFRPYVQRATYYQFLAGAYFDTTLEALSRWPRASLPTLSIIQDPLAADIAPTGRFAQPFVFFRLDPVSTLAGSEYVSTVAQLRFRVPSRHIARYLAANENTLPSVELLDISTTSITAQELGGLVSRLSRLKHLIVDGCPIVSQRMDALDADGAEDLGEWSALGLALVDASVDRSKLKERNYRLWAQALRVEANQGSGQSAASTSSHKKGRKGLATATISLRKPSGQASSSKAAPTVRPSKFLPSTEPQPEKIRVIPPLPVIRSLAITAPMLSPEKPDFQTNYAKVVTEFERGWSRGMHKILSMRAQMTSSWRNKTSVYKMNEEQLSVDDDEDTRADIMYGLEPVRSADDFLFTPPPCPLLCVVGPGKSQSHPEGCPHTAAWDAWKDEL